MCSRALACLLLLTSCRGSSTWLVVEVRSDFEPVEEVDGIVVSLAGGPAPFTHVVSRADDLRGGVRVAEYADLPASEQVLEVVLIGDGAVLVRRPVVVVLERRSTIVTVLATRSCRGVECPAADGDVNARACLGGRCVPADCTPERSASCGPPGCASDAECPAAAPCAVGRCASGVCVDEPVPGACQPAEWCDPSAGCRPRGPNEATDPPDPLVEFRFDEDDGSAIRDSAPRPPDLTLVLDRPDLAERSDGALTIVPGVHAGLPPGETADALAAALVVNRGLTLEAWIAVAAPTPHAHPLAIRTNEGTWLELDQQGDALFGWVYDIPTPTSRFADRIDTDVHHLVMTAEWDDAGSTVRHYFDGVRTSTSALPRGRVEAPPPGAVLELSERVFADDWAGRWHHLAFDDRAWSDADVLRRLAARP